jgi:prevent-host-death family protein
MLSVSATNFRSRLFEYLDMVSDGSVITIKRNNIEAARLVPVCNDHNRDWRSKISVKPKILVPYNEITEPLEDIWEDYI